MSSGQGIVIEDYAQFRRTIKKLSPEADKQFKVAMREMADEVAVRARDEAKRKRLVGEGRQRSRPNLIAGIKRGSVTMQKAEIKETAYRKRRRNRSGGLRRSYVGRDFAYPMVYEYGGRGQGMIGPRAFLNPSLMKSRDFIAKSFLDAVEKAATTAGFR